MLLNRDVTTNVFEHGNPDKRRRLAFLWIGIPLAASIVLAVIQFQKARISQSDPTDQRLQISVQDRLKDLHRTLNESPRYALAATDLDYLAQEGVLTKAQFGRLSKFAILADQQKPAKPGNR